MALEIKSIKIPRTRERVEVVFRQPRKDDSVEEYKVKLPEAPAPSFIKTLDSIAEIVITSCDLAQGPRADGFIIVTGLTFKAGNLGLMVGITADVDPGNDTFPDWEIRIEPMLISRLTEPEGKLIHKIEQETRKYLKGFRSQANLFQGIDPGEAKPSPKAQKSRNGDDDIPQ